MNKFEATSNFFFNELVKELKKRLNYLQLCSSKVEGTSEGQRQEWGEGMYLEGEEGMVFEVRRELALQGQGQREQRRAQMGLWQCSRCWW